MTKSQMEYIDYINRYARCTGENPIEIGQKLLTKEVGYEYGLSKSDVIEVEDAIKQGTV